MLKYKLIIFDLDGTIADTSLGILNSIRYTQKKLSLPEIPISVMKKFIGPSNYESYNRYFGLIEDKLAWAVSLHKEYAINKGYKELSFYDGIIDLFSHIRQEGSKIAVATLKANQTAVKIFDQFKLTNQIDMIKGVDIAKPQTKAQLLQECLTTFDVINKKTVLIGDSCFDAIGAAEVGVDFIGVTYGFGFKTKEDLKPYPNIGVVNSVGEIIQLLK